MPAQPHLVDVVEGWTGRLTFTLKSNGAPFNGTGTTLSDAIITGADGVEVALSGAQFGYISAAAGTVFYDPGAGDLTVALSPYTLRFKVTESGDDVFFPNGLAGIIRVYRP